MSKPLFKISPHTTVDKEFPIHGPDDLTMMVDYDDVYHPDVERNAKKVVRILNKYWESE